jgi:hypothetical protein
MIATLKLFGISRTCVENFCKLPYFIRIRIRCSYNNPLYPTAQVLTVEQQREELHASDQN